MVILFFLTENILNMLIDYITAKISDLSKAEFKYSYENDTENTKALDYDCCGIVMDATVLYFEIKNIPSMLKTGKRLATRVYKMYYHALLEVAKNTNGIFNCYTPESFLLIYPKEHHDVAYAVDVALKIADMFSNKLREIIEQHCHINFSIGIDKGNIMGTKVSADDKDQIVWFGSTIDKAKTISHECNRPFFVGTSGTVHHHLDEEHRVTTKSILGFKKQIDIWTTVSYQFENVKKHLYQTNLLKSFDE